MRILGKQGDELHVLLMPGESLNKGDYLKIHDGKEGMALVVQIYDLTYLDSPGIAEDILRDELFSSSELVRHDPLQVENLGSMIRDAKVLLCKIRGLIRDGSKNTDFGWLPSRSFGCVSRMSVDELRTVSRPSGNRRMKLGSSLSGEEFHISAEDLDGRLNIITGRKEAGKSHMAKLLVSGLLDYGARVLIFDINGEYGGLSFSPDGSPSRYAKKVKVLQPGHNLRFTLRYLGKRIMVDLLQNVLEVPGATMREFMRVWDYLEQTGRVTLKDMEETMLRWRCNELVRDALLARYYSLLSFDLVTDNERYATTLEEEFDRFPDGCALVISLGGTGPLGRRMAVEALLAKTVELEERRAMEPVFLFAEEAHLYLRHTYWEDLITRMRHFGVFTTFVTNQPDAINPGIYRQVDNIFLYNFTSDKDVDMVSQASMTDFETVKSIVKSLPPRHCLVLGRVVGDMPMVVRVDPAEFQTLGFTRLFFKEREAVAKVT
ncbi:MAG: ATP-binding protein [Nitrososphaerota archaeon]|nr:ATP-binding protein [Nitrososphaerota archaeon]